MILNSHLLISRAMVLEEYLEIRGLKETRVLLVFQVTEVVPVIQDYGVCLVIKVKEDWTEDHVIKDYLGQKEQREWPVFQVCMTEVNHNIVNNGFKDISTKTTTGD